MRKWEAPSICGKFVLERKNLFFNIFKTSNVNGFETIQWGQVPYQIFLTISLAPQMASLISATLAQSPIL
jgi:hypothetical protein